MENSLVEICKRQKRQNPKLTDQTNGL